MASRKQKHALAVAKHEAFMEEMRVSGLKAQEVDRKRREAKVAKAEQERLDRILEQENRRRSRKNAKAVHKIHKETTVEQVRNLAMAMSSFSDEEMDRFREDRLREIMETHAGSL